MYLIYKFCAKLSNLDEVQVQRVRSVGVGVLKVHPSDLRLKPSLKFAKFESLAGPVKEEDGKVRQIYFPVTI